MALLVSWDDESINDSDSHLIAVIMIVGFPLVFKVQREKMGGCYNQQASICMHLSLFFFLALDYRLAFLCLSFLLYVFVLLFPVSLC